MSDTPSRVLIVDDDASVRGALCRLLRTFGYSVSTADSTTGIELSRESQVPTCLILDIQMPGVNGVEFHKSLVASGYDVPTIFLTGHGDIPTSVRAMKNGAVDFLTKPVMESDLLAAVKNALQKHVSGMARRRELTVLRTRYQTLTPREQQVMAEVVAGRLNKQAAVELGIVEKTIKVHRARVMEKMGAVSLADLVRYAEALGIGAKPLFAKTE